MARGFPHRMRFKAFNARYRILADPIARLARIDEKAVEDCEIILDCYSRALRKLPNYEEISQTNNNKDWAHGRKHVFLSEGARQQLELMRQTKRQNAARKIQKVWRFWHANRDHRVQNKAFQSAAVQSYLPHPAMAAQNPNSTLRATIQRPRPQPISGTPPPCQDPQSMLSDRCDFKTIQQTCSLFGLDLVSLIFF